MRGVPSGIERAGFKDSGRAGNNLAHRIILSKMPSAPPLRSPVWFLSSWQCYESQVTSLNNSLPHPENEDISIHLDYLTEL